MPALVAGIHVFSTEPKDVDGRNKSGHDGSVSALPYLIASNSTSNISVAFGGMTPPAPRAP
jgi:hypothetical protein